MPVEGKTLKFAPEQATKVRGGGEKGYNSTLSLTSARSRWVVNAVPLPLYPQERPGTHCIDGWVGPKAGMDGCGKSRPPPRFDPRTVQPVASRYTDWGIPADRLIMPVVLIMNLAGFFFSLLFYLCYAWLCSAFSAAGMCEWYFHPSPTWRGVVYLMPSLWFLLQVVEGRTVLYFMYPTLEVQYSTVLYYQRRRQLKESRSCNVVFILPTADCDFM